MNLRIEKIIDLAYIELNKESPDRFFGQRTVANKVAELVVEECVRNLDIHTTCFDGDVSRGIKTAARLTKELFGVEG